MYAINLLINIINHSTYHYASLMCRSDLASFVEVKVVHILREGHGAIHKNAKFAGQNQIEFTVFDDLPSFLVLNVLADCMYGY